MKTPEQPTLEKALNNEATPEEARVVARWFGTKAGQEWLSERIDADEQEILEETETEYIDHPLPSSKIYDSIMEKIRRQKTRRLLLNIAAIVIPFVLFAGFYFELNSRVDLFGRAEYDEVFVPKGEQIQILFQDGSRAFLNAGSYLRYPRKFGLTERKVELNGEGWFEVARSKGRPFIVEVEDLKIKVLGTTFDLKAYSEDTHVTITQETGSIKLSGPTFLPFDLKPGDKVIYNKYTGKCLISQPEDIKKSSVWKERFIDFADTPLTDVITTLNRTFDVTFEVEDKNALKYHYTLHTQKNNLDSIFWELEKIAPVRFEKKENQIHVRLEK